MELQQKLEILADAAKYDASCASSGGERRDSRKGGIGSSGGSGICHAYTPDGRCISLLKILLTNHCVFDCHYCINRRSSNVQRARFTPDEVVRLTLDFYKRNFIEGLFLSSGIIQSPDYTMEQVVEVARVLRPGGTAFVIDNDATRSTFGGWFRQAMPSHDPVAVERFWARQGWSRDRIDMRWAFGSRADFEAVLRIEFSQTLVDGILADHQGTGVDYAVSLWWRTFA